MTGLARLPILVSDRVGGRDGLDCVVQRRRAPAIPARRRIWCGSSGWLASGSRTLATRIWPGPKNANRYLQAQQDDALGEQALKARDYDKAMSYFRQANGALDALERTSR